VLHSAAPGCAMLYCTELYCAVRCGAVLRPLRCAAKYCSELRDVMQCGAALHCAALHCVAR
jgi:hypothetical protein